MLRQHIGAFKAFFVEIMTKYLEVKLATLAKIQFAAFRDFRYEVLEVK